MNAKIIQHVIEPSLIQAMSNGKEIVDLTSSLLKQGISHWKHSHKTIQFHPPPKTIKASTIPFFPTDQTFSYVRIGCQIVNSDGVVVLKNGNVLFLSKLYIRNDTLMLDGYIFESAEKYTASVKEVRMRFDPCFDVEQLYKVYAQCDWNGDAIIRSEQRVNFK